MSEKKMQNGDESRKKGSPTRDIQPEYTNANPSFSLSSVSKYLIKLNVMRSFTILMGGGGTKLETTNEYFGPVALV